MKNLAIIIFCACFISLGFQRCSEDNKPTCDCDKTDFVIDFNDREGNIYYADDGVSWRAWVISVRSEDNSQILVGKICNLNTTQVQQILTGIPSDSNSATPVIFSGRVTQLCSTETSPTATANVSFFYVKVGDIKLK